MNRRIAILQHRIIPGGRLSVISAMIELLNAYGIVPDIIAGSMPKQAYLLKNYNKELKFRFKRVYLPTLPTDLEIPIFNALLHEYMNDYDLIINTSNSNLFVSDEIPIIYYVFYPRKGRIFNSSVSLHYPEKKMGNLNFRSYYRLFLRHIYRFEKITVNSTVLVISKYVQNEMKKYFNLSSKDINIVYPPVKFGHNNDRGKLNQVVSIGRFKSYKRQLEQLEMARRFPNYDFLLIGFISSKSYYRKCKNFVRNNKICNAFLKPNLPYEEMINVLQTSRFFVHNVVNEPFGITTVQAIISGCVPVVHDSGGQKEIVPVNRLRFSSVEDALSILNSLVDSTNHHDISDNLIRHVETNFSESRFYEDFGILLSAYL
jgi:hypothetical protein